MLVRGRFVIDESALKILIAELRPYLNMDIKEIFIESDRCVSIKTKYNKFDVEIKLKPIVYNGHLAIDLFKIFVSKGLEISYLVGAIASSIKSKFKNYPVDIEGTKIIFNTVKASYSGILKKEILFDGIWNIGK